MTKETPLVSIISVNFNGMEDTCQMIDSIIKQVTIDYEIIIVDNGSEKDEAEMIRLKYPQVRVFRSEKNLGFAGGNNLGIDLARGKYFFFPQ